MKRNFLNITLISVIILSAFFVGRHIYINKKICEAELKIEQLEDVKNCEIFIKKHIALVYIKPYQDEYIGSYEEKEAKQFVYDTDIPGVWDIKIVSK